MHPDSPRAAGLRFPNVNVVLGANGVGKTSLLKAAALATLNPIWGRSGYRPYYLIRRVAKKDSNSLKASISSSLVLQSGEIYEQKDKINLKIPGYKTPEASLLAPFSLESVDILETSLQFVFDESGEETLTATETFDTDLIPSNNALLAISYGAMRRVERLPSYDIEAQNQQYSYRYLRMANLFDSRVVLTPLVSWFPELPESEAKRVLEVFASLMPAKLGFSDSIYGRELSFHHNKNKILIPFSELADGHRSYIGWVSDLLYHLHRANPKNVQDVRGVVLVDEVDFLAHPTWQRTIVPDLSKVFPKLQFILTTHSPIVAASVEAANLFILEPGRNGTARLTRPDSEVYGLNAQQVLHEVFGMDSTRAPGFERKLRKLAKESRAGNIEATEALMQGLAYGAGKPLPFEDDDLDIASMQEAARELLESGS